MLYVRRSGSASRPWSRGLARRGVRCRHRRGGIESRKWGHDFRPDYALGDVRPPARRRADDRLPRHRRRRGSRRNNRPAPVSRPQPTIFVHGLRSASTLRPGHELPKTTAPARFAVSFLGKHLRRERPRLTAPPATSTETPPPSSSNARLTAAHALPTAGLEKAVAAGNQDTFLQEGRASSCAPRVPYGNEASTSRRALRRPAAMPRRSSPNTRSIGRPAGGRRPAARSPLTASDDMAAPPAILESQAPEKVKRGRVPPARRRRSRSA